MLVKNPYIGKITSHGAQHVAVTQTSAQRAGGKAKKPTPGNGGAKSGAKRGGQ